MKRIVGLARGLALGLGLSLGLLAHPAAAQFPDVTAQAFLMYLQPGATLGTYTERLRQEFRQLDADQDGVLTAADADLHDAVAKAQLRMAAAMQLLRADLDRDGAVTADELRRYLAYERRNQTGAAVAQSIDAEVRRVMAADKDGDGKVTLAEAMSAADGLADNRYNAMFGLSARVRQLVAQSHSGDGRLALADFEALGAEQFRAVDADKNGTISQDELNGFRRRQAEETRRKAEAEREAKTQAECVMPKASDAAKVVLLSARRGEALSRVALGSQDVVTGTGEIRIEPGAEPLYIVVVTDEPTIWRLTGAVDRVERLVGAGLSTMEAKARVSVSAGTITLGSPPGDAKKADATPLIGFSGLLAERISFMARTNCLKAFVEAKSTDAAAAVALVRRHSGKEPAVVVGRYNVGAFVVPSGTIRSGFDDKTQPRLTIVKEFGTLTLQGDTSGVVVQTGPIDLDQDLASSRPGGVIDVDEKSVVAGVPVARYDMLPGLAGLMQLQNSGAITRNKRGEFIIHRQIRLPAGLSDHPVKFLLLHGVPLPTGDTGGATVISEDTGQVINFDRR
jgi:Ca2+-binding EF-hand superfamily protein